MINYSEDPDRLYHIQTAKGEVGRYVMFFFTSMNSRSRLIWMSRS